jgi:hypothetical protein
MPGMMDHNLINVRQGDRCFIVATNLCDFFQIGDETSAYLLRAEMVGPEKEFLFNGRLFLPGHGQSGTIIDNFPKGPTPHGWEKRQRIGRPGYELLDRTGNTILFGFEEIGNVCHVTTNVYDGSGALVAETLSEDFLVHRGPARLGTQAIFIP